MVQVPASPRHGCVRIVDGRATYICTHLSCPGDSRFHHPLIRVNRGGQGRLRGWTVLRDILGRACEMNQVERERRKSARVSRTIIPLFQSGPEGVICKQDTVGLHGGTCFQFQGRLNRCTRTDVERRALSIQVDHA